MGEADILKVLENCDKPITAKEMEEKLNIARGNINSALKSLRIRGEIKFVLKKHKDAYQKVYHYYL